MFSEEKHYTKVCNALQCTLNLIPDQYKKIIKGRESWLFLLLMSYRCIVTVNVLWLFLAVLWVGLLCVIVVFPDHTHFLIKEFDLTVCGNKHAWL